MTSFANSAMNSEVTDRVLGRRVVTIVFSVCSAPVHARLVPRSAGTDLGSHSDEESADRWPRPAPAARAVAVVSVRDGARRSGRGPTVRSARSCDERCCSTPASCHARGPTAACDREPVVSARSATPVYAVRCCCYQQRGPSLTAGCRSD